MAEGSTITRACDESGGHEREWEERKRSFDDAADSSSQSTLLVGRVLNDGLIYIYARLYRVPAQRHVRLPQPDLLQRGPRADVQHGLHDVHPRDALLLDPKARSEPSNP